MINKKTNKKNTNLNDVDMKIRKTMNTFSRLMSSDTKHALMSAQTLIRQHSIKRP